MAKKKAIPPHFSSLSLKNFRGFQSAKDIELRPLTFLVGPVDANNCAELRKLRLHNSSPKW